MNERDLNSGLRQLSDGGWFVAEVTDDFLEVLLGKPGDPPPGGVKNRSLSKLRARVQDAMKRKAEGPYDLSRNLSVEVGRKPLRTERSRKFKPGERKA